MDTQEKHSMMFLHLVSMFQASCMLQLGKIKNPLTDKIERNLPAAQGTIDLLDMLKEKTKGNLTKEEEQILTTVLRELRLNYVDEKNKPDPPENKEEAEAS